MSLQSPSGTQILLTTSVFDGTDDFIGTWADDGGDFTPEEPFSDFLLEDGTGTWTFQVQDEYGDGSGNADSFDGWALHLVCI